MLAVVCTDQDWKAVVWDEQVIRPAAEDLATRLGLTGENLRRYPEGSRPVYQVGVHRVLKLYPTISAPDSLRAHLRDFGTAAGGRVFAGVQGGELPSITYRRAWDKARRDKLSAAEYASPLARRRIEEALGDPGEGDGQG